MADHLTAADVTRYCARQLSATKVLQCNDHLFCCEECRAKVRSARENESYNSWTFEEVAGVLDHSLDSTAAHVAEDKLARFPQMRAELADLRQFKNQMNAPRFEAWKWLWPIAAAIVLAAASFWWQGRTAKISAGATRDLSAFPLDDETAQVLARLSPEVQNQIQTSLREQRLDFPSEAIALRGRPGILAGGGTNQPFRLLEPVGTMVRSNLRFRWERQNAATTYRVNIASEESGEIVASQEVASTDWTPSQVLAPGRVYQWEVEALRDGAVLAKAPVPPAAEARFAVLSKEAANRLEQELGKSKESQLLRGMMEAQAGLFEDARADLQAFRRTHPESTLAKKFLEQIQNASPTATNGAQ